jgi:hypothetical protein
LCAVRHWLQCSLLWIGLDLQSGKTTPPCLRQGRHPDCRDFGVLLLPRFNRQTWGTNGLVRQAAVTVQ